MTSSGDSEETLGRAESKLALEIDGLTTRTFHVSTKENAVKENSYEPVLRWNLLLMLMSCSVVSSKKNTSASPSSFIFKESHSLPGNPFNNITTKLISYSDSCDLADHDSNSSKCPCLLHHLILIVMLHSCLLHRHQLPWFVSNGCGESSLV